VTDVFTPAERSRVMAMVKSRDTGPELRLARLFRAAGVRYRRCVRGLPGTPDFVLPAYRLAVFVHGCFWHGHAACAKGRKLPRTRRAFWRAKIARNRRRDARAARALRALAYGVYVLFECSLSDDALPARLRTRLGLGPTTAAKPPRTIRRPAIA
jgi:DNA mismatch endonuclease (patch repair protein)